MKKISQNEEIAGLHISVDPSFKLAFPNLGVTVSVWLSLTRLSYTLSDPPGYLGRLENTQTYTRELEPCLEPPHTVEIPWSLTLRLLGQGSNNKGNFRSYVA